MFDPEAYLESKLVPQQQPQADDGHETSQKRRSPSNSKSPRHHSSHSPRRSSKDRGDRESRDRDRDYRDRDRDRERGGDRKRDSRDRERDDRDGERRKDRRERSPEDPTKEAERLRKKEEENFDRDLRTVFVTQIHMKAEERDVWEFFSKAGKVSDVRLIKDQRTRKSKGIGYVEMANHDDVIKALSMTGQLLMGFPVMVQASQAEKNRVAATPAQAAQQGQNPVRLFLGSLHVNINEEDLRSMFSPFGDIDFTHIQRDVNTNMSRGSGFVQFRRIEDAQKAMANMQGLDMGGRPLRITMGPLSTDLKQQQPQQQQQQQQQSHQQQDLASTSLGEFDDDIGGGGVAMSAQSRASLMAKLGRGQMPQPEFNIPGMQQQQQQKPQEPLRAPPPTHPPTPFLLLKNMFDPALETDPNFHLDIANDVEEECSKFGKVIKVFADKTNPNGHVYVEFTDREFAFGAQKALNGRWFARKMIIADYLPEAAFRAVVG